MQQGSSIPISSPRHGDREGLLLLARQSWQQRCMWERLLGIVGAYCATDQELLQQNASLVRQARSATKFGQCLLAQQKQRLAQQHAADLAAQLKAQCSTLNQQHAAAVQEELSKLSATHTEELERLQAVHAADIATLQQQQTSTLAQKQELVANHVVEVLQLQQSEAALQLEKQQVDAELGHARETVEELKASKDHLSKQLEAQAQDLQVCDSNKGTHSSACTV